MIYLACSRAAGVGGVSMGGASMATTRANAVVAPTMWITYEALVGHSVAPSERTADELVVKLKDALDRGIGLPLKAMTLGE